MRRIQLPFKGIQRNTPISDGCHDMINLRPKDGAWRPVGQKNDVAVSADGQSYTRYIHKISDTKEAHWFPYGGTIQYRVYVSGSAQTIQNTGNGYSDEDDWSFTSLGNTLISIDSDQKEFCAYVFEHDTNTYREVGDLLPELLNARIIENMTGPAPAQELDGDVETYESQMLAYLNDANKGGLFLNDAYFCYAYELFDGSIVKPSMPVRIKGGRWYVNDSGDDQDGEYEKIWEDDATPDLFKFAIYVAYPQFQISDSNLSSIKTAYNGIIKSINIYMSRPRQDFSVSTVKIGSGDDQYYNISVTNHSLNSVDNFYLVRQYSMEELDSSAHYILADTSDQGSVDLTQITTMASLPYDDLTHIDKYSETPFVYNQRLIFGNIRNTLPPPFNPDMCNLDDDGSGTSLQLRFEVTINTDQGEKIVRSDLSTAIELTTIEGTLDCFAYPDRRASKVRILCYYSSTYYYDTDIPLTPHPIFGFAYAEDLDWSDDTGSVSLQTVDDEYWDYNRVQASEVFNPYYYPALNSYRVGHSLVVGLGTNALDISQGQFGQYPIYVFTEDGIWVLELGTEDIFIQSIKPLSRHVCNNKNSIIAIAGGVVFSTNKGLFIISGPNIQEISKDAEGDNTSPLSAVLTKPYTNASFLTFLSGAVIGYDYVNNEIILSNSSYQSSWVFSVDNGMWFTIGQTWERFVSDFPKMWGYTDDTNYRYDMTVEDDPDDVRIQLETRPLNLGGEGYKKIMRTILESELFPKDGDQIDIKVYGSLDRGTTWGLAMSASITQATDGNTREVVLSRSKFSAHKFIIVVDGDAEMDTTITGFIADVEDKFQRKLR